MKWEKKGLIYQSPEDNSWRDNSALTPTAFLLDTNIIRVYASFRDTQGVGRIGYIDVNANNPSDVLKISDKPVLDIGKDGMFDDNGVILGDLIRVDNKIYMYYVGFQLVKKSKFLAYSGLAISEDNGENSFLGVNCTIEDNTKIAKDNFIGAGALIQKDTNEKDFYQLKQTELSKVNTHRLFRIKED